MRKTSTSSHSRVALLLISATAACTSTGINSNSSLGERPVLQGKIDSWSSGPGFSLEASVISAPDGISGLATAPIDEFGNFAITLPDAFTLASYLVQQNIDPKKPLPNCSGIEFQSNPQQFMTAVLRLQAIKGSTKFLVFQGNPTTNVAYIYSDKEVNQVGSIKCIYGTLTATEMINVHLTRGWNREIIIPNATGSTTTTGELPDGVKWTAQ